MNLAAQDPASRPDPAAGRPPLSQETFQSLRTLLYDHSGIALSPHKVTMVQSRLAKRLRALGLDSYEAYLTLLQESASAEWGQFINALTTNLTSFFREPHHFSRLVELLTESGPPPRPVRVWSAGCSTGEEPYSLAMTLLQAFGSSHPVEILATDLDTSVLETASRGIYPSARIDHLDPGWHQFAFLRGLGAQAGLVRIRPEVRQAVRFERLNLQESEWPVHGPFHAVFCRNVMIYFDKPTQRELVQRFRSLLAPGGLLVVGHSESLLNAAVGLEPLGQTIYRRKEARP